MTENTPDPDTLPPVAPPVVEPVSDEPDPETDAGKVAAYDETLQRFVSGVFPDTKAGRKAAADACKLSPDSHTVKVRKV